MWPATVSGNNNSAEVGAGSATSRMRLVTAAAVGKSRSQCTEVVEASGCSAFTMTGARGKVSAQIVRQLPHTDSPSAQKRPQNGFGHLRPCQTQQTHRREIAAEANRQTSAALASAGICREHCGQKPTDVGIGPRLQPGHDHCECRSETPKNEQASTVVTERTSVGRRPPQPHDKLDTGFLKPHVTQVQRMFRFASCTTDAAR